MKSFKVVPSVVLLESCQEFCERYKIGAGDLIFASASTLARSFPAGFEGALVIDYRQYGSGEPTDLMVNGISRAIGSQPIKRVFAIGGGTILDVAKLFALKEVFPVADLFDGTIEAVRDKELILLPTTCGTGSEMTNISILELTEKKTKMGLAVDALYADEAVLVPELLEGLPFKVFAASSLDALIHAVESFTSPKANALTQMFSLKAMELILKGYQQIAESGEAARQPLLPDFLLASTYAGIAFGNAGCAAVHALSYPLGAAKHVPHGEANYVMFMEVYQTYRSIRCDGSLQLLEQHLAKILACPEDIVYETLGDLLGHILTPRKMSEYGVKEEDLELYTDIVMTKQTRLMANNYVELSAEKVRSIYQKLF